MEFGHLLDYNQYITAVFKSQVFLRRIEKKTAHVAPMDKRKKFKTEESTSIVSITGCELFVNAWQKKTSPRGAHRKGYGQ